MIIMAGRICRICLGIAAAVYVPLAVIFISGNIAVGAAIVVLTDFILTQMLNAGFKIAADNGYGDSKKLDKILSAVSIEMLILSIPVMIFPIIDWASDVIFAVYVNIIGIILLATVLVLHKRN